MTKTVVLVKMKWWWEVKNMQMRWYTISWKLNVLSSTCIVAHPPTKPSTCFGYVMLGLCVAAWAINCFFLDHYNLISYYILRLLLQELKNSKIYSQQFCVIIYLGTSANIWENCWSRYWDTFIHISCRKVSTTLWHVYWCQKDKMLNLSRSPL